MTDTPVKGVSHHISRGTALIGDYTTLARMNFPQRWIAPCDRPRNTTAVSDRLCQNILFILVSISGSCIKFSSFRWSNHLLAPSPPYSKAQRQGTVQAGLSLQLSNWILAAPQIDLCMEYAISCVESRPVPDCNTSGIHCVITKMCQKL